MGYLAKTDKLDAAMLAQLAQIIVRHPGRSRFIRALPDKARGTYRHGRPSPPAE